VIVPKFEKQQLADLIAKRVKRRFRGGAVEEVVRALKKYPELCRSDAWRKRLPLGFEEIRKYLEGEIGEAECLRRWALHEHQYAKRQLTFLKKFFAHEDLVITPT
jgi:tRNA A37 N6-isopentenylltransferase MiaA